MLKAILFIAPGCPHCPAVLQALSELLKDGEIAEMEVSNMALMPEKAQKLGIRSVPWIKIGAFELTGSQTKGELLNWIKRSQSASGMQDYFQELLTTGKLNTVISLLKKEPELLSHLAPMIENKDVPLGAKIGIGAVFEEFHSSSAMQPLIPLLIKLLDSKQSSVRHDACHYLGLTKSPDAIAAIKPLLNDNNEEIRETAHEALQMISETNKI